MPSTAEAKGKFPTTHWTLVARIKSDDRRLGFEGSAARYQREQFTDADTPARVSARKWAIELIRQGIETLAARYRLGKSTGARSQHSLPALPIHFLQISRRKRRRNP